MSQERSGTPMVLVISLLAVGGVAGLLTDANSAPLLLLGAVVFALAQRSALARAIRTPVAGGRRRRRMIIGTVAMIGAVVFFVVGLLTPKIQHQHTGPLAERG